MISNFGKNIEKGFKQAREDGIKEGREKAIKEGIEKEKLEIARNMLTEALSVEMIIKVTGLNKEQLKILMN